MKLLEETEGYVSDKLGVIKKLLSLMKMEAQLAGLSVYPLLVNLCALFIVFITVWFLAMFLIGYGISLVLGNLVWAVFCVFLLNLACLLGLLKYLAFNLRNMSFAKTRNYFTQKESKDYEHLEKTIDRRHRTDGQEITNPAQKDD
jgi:predicted membrane protein